MKPKYEKPLFRALGDAVPIAAGICGVGNDAGHGQNVGTCEPYGSVASGGHGNDPDCVTGNIPKKS